MLSIGLELFQDNTETLPQLAPIILTTDDTSISIIITSLCHMSTPTQIGIFFIIPLVWLTKNEKSKQLKKNLLQVG